MILLPEIDFDLERVAAVCRERHARRRATLICIAEGARPVGGTLTVERTVAGSPDPIRLGAWRTCCASGFGTAGRGRGAPPCSAMQRGGSPTPFDRVLATQYGNEAAHLLRRGQFGRMVTLRDGG